MYSITKNEILDIIDKTVIDRQRMSLIKFIVENSVKDCVEAEKINDEIYDTLASNIRKFKDSVFLYGTNQFIVFLKDCKPKDSKFVAERLLNKIQGLNSEISVTFLSIFKGRGIKKESIDKFL